MGLTKQYLRFVQSAVFGVVGTTKANVVFTKDHQFVAVSAVEHVIIWSLKRAEKVLLLEGSKHEVTCLAQTDARPIIAVGYSDGSIKLFDSNNGDMIVTFNGHKTAVSTMHFDEHALRLASGSKDTDVIIWDVVNESGLYRLKGHRGMVTRVNFMAHHNIVISSSKDTFVKFWDLDTQHCFKTLVGHRSEVWDFALLPDDKGLVTGTSGSDLQVWDITFQDELEGDDGDNKGPSPAKRQRRTMNEDDDEEEDEDDDEEGDDNSILTCTKAGTILRKGSDRVVSLHIDSTGRILGCHGPSPNLELFKVCNAQEQKKKLLKKQKRERKRSRGEDGDEVDVSNVKLTAEDKIQPLTNIKASAKLRSFYSHMDRNGEVRLVTLLQNNTLEAYKVDLTADKPVGNKEHVISLAGHRHDVRTLSISSDNTALLSAGGNAVKIWNRSNQQCIRTMKCGHVLSSIFAPGNRHCIVGNKAGQLEMFDIASGSLMESFEAHEGAVWSICLSPDKRGFVTGSADKTLKFWEFELVSSENDEGRTVRELSIVHTRTLKMSDDVLCVKYSPDGRLVAASLLDSTVKVFFADTLKFFLSLYGHKLPVLNMDISSDSTLLVTGSADRNVKLWGLDFGDCHKSMFAHDDSVMCIGFLPDTHLFFTGGKDGKIKQWDGDHFQQITTLEGHHGEVWCMAISPDGSFMVSASHDKSLRIWEKTEEPLVLEEEQEMERERKYEESLNKEEQPIAGEPTGGEVSLPEKRTTETLKGAERLMEALNLYQEETAKMEDYKDRCKAAGKELPPPDQHPILMAYGNLSPLRYVGDVIKKIKSSELEESLLVLPLDYVLQLLPLLETLIQESREVELACRCLLFLLRIHHGQITSNHKLLPMIDRLRKTTLTKADKLRDTIGFNLAGLRFLKDKLEAENEVQLFADATANYQTKKKKQKKRAERAIIKL
nr:WD repeat-containing protein 3-like [Lytechinus pictus]